MKKYGPGRGIGACNTSGSSTQYDRSNHRRRQSSGDRAEREGSAPMRSWADNLRQHWPEYLMEAAGLGIFMVSAAMVTTLFEYPKSPLHDVLRDPRFRRVLIGIAMGLTAIAIIYSPWGKQSGAHLNPAVTLTFFRLRKIEGIDAFCYTVAQSIGGLIGLVVASLAIGRAIEHPAVNYVVTVPGNPGPGIAFVAETVISFGLMLTVLLVSNHKAL